MKRSPLRRGRELAMQALYQRDLAHVDAGDLLDTIDSTLGPPEEAKALARELVCGVCETLEQLDQRIILVADHWDIQRMSAIDRNCLRLACYELVARRDIPFRVIIDEAIEVAKRYGSEQSGAFVNGILDAIAKMERKSEVLTFGKKEKEDRAPTDES